MIRKSVVCLFVATLFSCTYTKSGPEPKVYPEVYGMASFTFIDVEWAQIDTVKQDSVDYYFDNQTADTVWQPLRLDKYEYSYFHEPDQQLPEGSNIDSLMVNVGEPFSTTRFEPFAFGKKQEFFESGAEVYVIKLPPGWYFEGSIRYISYKASLPYTATLRNIYSNEKMEVAGIWEGVVRNDLEIRGASWKK